MSTIDHCFESPYSWVHLGLHYLIKIMLGNLNNQKILFYHLLTSGRVEINLEDVDTSQMYIFFINICYHYNILVCFCDDSISLYTIFYGVTYWLVQSVSCCFLPVLASKTPLSYEDLKIWINLLKFRNFRQKARDAVGGLGRAHR